MFRVVVYMLQFHPEVPTSVVFLLNRDKTTIWTGFAGPAIPIHTHTPANPQIIHSRTPPSKEDAANPEGHFVLFYFFLSYRIEQKVILVRSRRRMFSWWENIFRGLSSEVGLRFSVRTTANFGRLYNEVIVRNELLVSKSILHRRHWLITNLCM